MFKQMAVTLCTLLSLAGTTAWAAGTTAPEETTLRTVPTSFADTAASQAAASALVQVKAPAKSDTATAPVVTITPAASAPADTQSAAPKKADEKKIMLNLASRILTLYQGNTKITMYPVGVGKASTPSPTGTYSITDKEVNPTWIDPDTGTQVPSGPACPLGYRWLGLFGNYGIHGTNAPSSIGGYVSHGCIRMHEADVEDLYNRVSIGTPVIIYYDRIVIDRDPDHTISYYIYPDGYGRQPLTAEQVKQALAGYGVEDFEEYGDIYNKIAASDGQPTYVAKAYDLYVNGQKLTKRALGKGGSVWLPVFTLASAMHTQTSWNGDTQMVTTAYGTAPGVVHSDVVYIDSEDAYILYRLQGRLTGNLVYTLQSVAPAAGTTAGTSLDEDTAGSLAKTAPSV